MNLPEAIYQHALRLPEPAAREALDFIEFLEQRYGASPDTDELEAHRQAALAHLDTLTIDWQGKPIPDRAALYDGASTKTPKPRTLLGQRLLQLRENHVANGGRLLSPEELDEEVRQRRGGLACE